MKPSPTTNIAPQRTPEEELRLIKELRSKSTFPEPDLSHFAQEKAPSPKGGRPSLLSDEIVRDIIYVIRCDGCSDSHAGLLAGVSTSTLSRWKQENEEFAFLLEQARAQFEVARLRNIGRAALRDGQLNWRAQAWLLQQSSPETYGSPSRRRAAQAKEEVRKENPLAITPEMLGKLQERRREVLEKMAGPEDRSHTTHGTHEAPPSQNATILPETSPGLGSTSGATLPETMNGAWAHPKP